MSSAVMTNELLLASSSPRRRDLLAQAGLAFRVVPPALPEPTLELACVSPGQQAEALAFFKARSVSEQHPDAYVLGADTVVAVGPLVLGKPRDRRHAETMLRLISGTRHEVITGVALLCPDGRRVIASDVTFVTMRELTGEELEGYLESQEWDGKAGAYAIQETADRFVTGLEGSLSNVVGLPMEMVERILNDVGRSAGAEGENYVGA